MTTLNLGYLATFRLVIQRGSFSAAADVLGISQPAVSLQIRQLEQFLQTRLVERTGRGIKATAAGQALLVHGERIEQAVDETLRSVSAFNHDVSGTITLGTGATACIHLLPPLLQQLRSDYPLLRVGVTTGNTLDIVRAIEENRLDMGLVTMPVSGRALDVMPVMDEEFVFIASQAQQAMFTDLRPDALHTLPLIAFESGSGTRALIDGWFEASGLTIAPAMQLGSIEAIKRMVRSGLGYSIVPKMAVEQKADREGLCVSSLSPVLQRQLAVVMRQDKILSKGISGIIRILQQHPER
ncbi:MULTISPECIES: LysR family transcriptional regulator [Enterobacter]|jgi:DNA-binding transcriptional LysR family regulator|uniref:LysR family transcriptional regulator n=1 Tax=Enterobacter TaxID=547 RepID=UPI001BDFD42C|nr:MULTISPECIES: LysR family transcriptional regulator [Enterobacter]MBT2102029.1 LysR family transcriptional regulator [Enterobacter mori]MCW4987137.1 LysR family transcriptional regulator [Enterobacter mori]MDF2527894.1 LysR family transcriptional regulator [Enterobacter mori]MDU7451526.1 LysR family transcriptional regulator [Enterobacter sp.]MEB8196932.1 LysR family transcriptional regulator [Enterobacter quasimori]